MKNRLLCSVLAFALMLPAASAQSGKAGYAKVWPCREGLSVAAKLVRSGRLEPPWQSSASVLDVPPEDPPERLDPEEAVVPEEPHSGQYYEFELGFLDEAGRYTPFLWEDGHDLTTGEALGDCPYRFRQTEPEPSGMDWSFYGGYICLPDPDGIASDLYDTTGRPLHIGGGDFYPISQVTGSTVVCRDANGGGQLWYNLETGTCIEVDLLGYPDWTTASLSPFCDGLAPASVYWMDENGEPTEARWGFVDECGQWVISPKYTDYVVCSASTVHQVFDGGGLALVRDLEGRWGGIDRQGNTVVPFLYDALWPAEDGRILFELDGAEGTLDPASGESGPLEVPLSC